MTPAPLPGAAASAADVADALARTGYLPDEGLRDRVYLAAIPAAATARCSSRARPASARPRWPRCWPAGPAASSSGSSATRASTSARPCTSGTTPASCCTCGGRGGRRGRRRRSDELEDELYSERFLVKRALLQAIARREGPPPILLIDEVDRADDEFEAFLLEVLSDYQITVPELGTFRAARPADRDPHVEPHPRRARRAEAPLPLPLGRAPELRARGGDRAAAGVPEVPRAGPPGGGRGRGDARPRLYKPPGVAETIDWAQSLAVLGSTDLVRGDRRLHARHRAEVPRGPGAGPPARRRRPREAGLRAWPAAGLTADAPTGIGRRRLAAGGVGLRSLRGGGLSCRSARCSPSPRRSPRPRARGPRRRLLGGARDAGAPSRGHRGLRPGLRGLLGAAAVRSERPPEPTWCITLAVDAEDGDGRTTPADGEPGDDPTITLRFSAHEVLRHKDFAAYSATSSTSAHQLMADLRLAGSPRRRGGW